MVVVSLFIGVIKERTASNKTRGAIKNGEIENEPNARRDADICIHREKSKQVIEEHRTFHVSWLAHNKSRRERGREKIKNEGTSYLLELTEKKEERENSEQ